jgi:hypothetical protein
MTCTPLKALATATLLAAGLTVGWTAHAATSFSNSLRGFTGDSTQAATQQAVAQAGFDFYSTDGFNLEQLTDPTVTFDAAGAHFGLHFFQEGGGGDNGRNYMRTLESDYATVNFVAEITIEGDLGAAGPVASAFFGLGSGDTALFGVPDWSTFNSSTFMTPEPGFVKTWKSANDVNQWSDNDPVPGLGGPGVRRLRMSYNAASRTIVYSIDDNYAGGAFAADYTAPVVDLNSVSCPEGCGGGTEASLYDEFDGWPVEFSKIYFGGDDQMTFRDFSVTVQAPGNANFNGDARIDGTDFLIWQRNFGTASGATLATGDADGNQAVNSADFAIWTSQFGAGAAVAAVHMTPEPGAGLLAAVTLGSGIMRRRANGRGR